MASASLVKYLLPPADQTHATVVPDEAATAAYVDRIVTVSDLPAPVTAPDRDGLLWIQVDAVGEWVGVWVSKAALWNDLGIPTPPAGTPGVPVWDGSAWVAVAPDVQAGAGLAVGTATGVIDVGSLPGSGVLVNADDIAVDRAVTDTWYVDLVNPQSIDGVKTFLKTPIVPNIPPTGTSGDPAESQHAVDRLYVDTAVSLLSGQTSMVGTFSAATGLVTTVFPGAPAGITVGAVLPAADTTNVGSYLLVDADGAIPATATVGDWVMSNGAGAWTVISLTTQYVVRADFTPAGGDVHGDYVTGMFLDLGLGIDRDATTRELYVKTDNATLEVSATDLVQIKDFGVTDIKVGAQLGALINVEMATTEVGGTQADQSVLTYDLATTRWGGKAAAAGIGKFVAVIGDGILTTIPVVHNLGTEDVVVSVYDVASKALVYCDVVTTGLTTATLSFAVAPAAGALRIVVVG